MTLEEFAADRLPGVLRFAAVLNKSEPGDAQAVIITWMKSIRRVGI